MIKLIEIINRYLFLLKDKLIRIRVKQRLKYKINDNPVSQELDVYWRTDFATELDLWGKDDVWIEIKYLLSDKKGKVIDACCGTGGTINALKSFQNLDIHGFDISDFLIKKAIVSGIPKDKLKVLDASNTDYFDGEFDYSYSIGSLEHFTLKGIDNFIREMKRITKKTSYHQIPIAKDKKFEGWLDLDQSYYNMGENWWRKHFEKYYDNVLIVDSFWKDPISNGKWFICY